LYQWDEMMQYTNTQGVQGICPPSWHLPTDEEWKVLEGSVDSQYGIGDNTWDDMGGRGFDAGANLKSISGWYFGGNGTDLFGFTGPPGGERYLAGWFSNIGYFCYWWTSTETDGTFAWDRDLSYYLEVYRSSMFFKEEGFSVRCLKDN
jgi:uncharacterized protein (TIGR02145 family)